MSIAAIGAMAGADPSALLGAIGVPSATDASLTGTSGTSGTDFAAVLAGGLEHVGQVQADADQLAVQAASGDLVDAHDYMIAATQAQLTTELTVTLRNKALDAFTEIMRMQG
jgi:flagellar hook-basal body complex protein FliE